jgi:hypothetical protein
MQDEIILKECASSSKLTEESFDLKQVDRSNSLKMTPRESVSLEKLKSSDIEIQVHEKTLKSSESPTNLRSSSNG